MIRNELKYTELKSIITPILKIRTATGITGEIKSILQLEDVVTGLTSDYKYQVEYKGYSLKITYLHQISVATSISIVFSKKMRWWEHIIPPGRSIINDIKRVIYEGCKNIKLKTYEHTLNGRGFESPQY